MIEFVTGDILKDDSQALVNPVNCVGVMGAGLAAQFKRAWPENFMEYKEAVRSKEIRPGFLLVYNNAPCTSPRYIINFPTKRHWKEKSRMEDIENGLRALVIAVKAQNIDSIALPMLGCGLGGLDWKDVRLRIVEAEKQMPRYVRVRVFEQNEREIEKGKE